jgi:pimeloyl-ACP methyl ester carboxylesterase
VRWIARGIVYAPNTDRVINPADDDGPERLKKLGVDRQLRVDVGPPSASLSVWIIEPTQKWIDHSPRGTILVLHGMQDRKVSMLSMGKTLAAEGYRAVLVDLRGHGRSSGQWLTYGVVESRDLSQLLDALASQGLITGPIGAYGASYGGATTIMLASIDSRAEAVVSVAAFASMREEVPHYVRHVFLGRFVTDSVIEASMDRAGRIASFNPLDASPQNAITRTQAHILLIHSRADEKIPYHQSESLHAAAKNHSELLLVDGEGHDSFYSDRKGILSHETVAWFGRWLSPGKPRQ